MFPNHNEPKLVESIIINITKAPFTNSSSSYTITLISNRIAARDVHSPNALANVVVPAKSNITVEVAAAIKITSPIPNLKLPKAHQY